VPGNDAVRDDGSYLRGYRSLLECLADVPEPRPKCGIRHRAAMVIAFAIAAVLTEADWVAALSEWAAEVLAALGRGPPLPQPGQKVNRRVDGQTNRGAGECGITIRPGSRSSSAVCSQARRA